ncbi:protein mono-ADP-ribosyltransferase PARP12-like [Branchiostoma lanceolatum]|uniref:protein mono-ADP-ribosyltransferase PARP12-like n=1 Tax=Branchiostoma lanceolatum TaxID=7740 RepID=UPI0034525E11
MNQTMSDQDGSPNSGGTREANPRGRGGYRGRGGRGRAGRGLSHCPSPNGRGGRGGPRGGRGMDRGRGRGGFIPQVPPPTSGPMVANEAKFSMNEVMQLMQAMGAAQIPQAQPVEVPTARPPSGDARPRPRSRQRSGGANDHPAPLPAKLPQACTWYNNRQRGCTKGDACTFLHVCSRYLVGSCIYDKNQCDFSHNILTPQNKIILQKFGITSTSEKAVIGIFKRDFVNKKKIEQGDKVPEKLDEICIFNIRQRCSYKTLCERWHCRMPYQWQYRAPGADRWRHVGHDLNVMVEEAFCKVTEDSYSPVRLDGNTCAVNFTIMKAVVDCSPGDSRQEFEVRRLSTSSSVKSPPGHLFVTEWLWYWQDLGGTWVEYGQMNKSGEVRGTSSLSSKDIEEKYQDQQDADVTFSTGHHQYVLRLRDMCQENTKVGTRRDVRRRPKFVSEEDVKNPPKPKHAVRAKSARGASAWDESTPANWSPISEDDEFVKVDVAGTSAEYGNVKTLFEQNGMAGTAIVGVKRVQNAFLWSAYNRKKAQLKKQNGGKDVEERLLFHGTQDAVVDAICQQNFDWRLSGSRVGQLYGQGTYFSASSHYSHSYAQQASNGRRYMFVVRVLVGAYTKGDPGVRRPPPVNPSEPYGRMYDSCVNDTANPNIFVIFDNAQCYPEHIIEY